MPKTRRRGSGSKLKAQKKSRAKFIREVRNVRSDEIRSRESSFGPNGRTALTIGPRHCPEADSLLTKPHDWCPDVREFYRAQRRMDNDYLTVSEGKNVSNPEGEVGGGKGVFAKKDIPAGTTLCPYLGHERGVPCPASEKCQYDLQLHKGYILCAREVKFDLGYLQSWDESDRLCAIKLETPCPPNYGRYINTLWGDRVSADFNCVFSSADDGQSVMFIEASRDISAGEELLVEYGRDFVLVK